jgi:hypothetical protein
VKAVKTMREPASKESAINAHFRREGVMPGILTVGLIILCVAMAFVVPWLYERL